MSKETLEWTWEAPETYSTYMETGMYYIIGEFLWFAPRNGFVIDRFAEGKEYLGQFPNPKEAALNHHQGKELPPLNQ